ncbi:carbohydrate ABC transporter permease [Paenibacillus ehimensis]|uniref:Carbohydrate ABC transporter permease n=1 Tax=Paenibacillus ehimensis TaxID=79264 RepID=A0ABT8V5W6_9BACL|nr:carbohydrate ABC transporter permease [Paenibacillus ehimensis]MDO3676828.1 carbohydrate ABC transporter permease [Paenibacillus ehimensis]
MRFNSKIPMYIFVWLMVLMTAYPFFYMVLGSFKENFEILSLNFSILPRNGFHFSKYTMLFENWPFIRNMANSIVVSVGITVSAAFFCLLSGYTFAKYKFPGKNVLFIIMLSTMMIPFETRLIPSYLLIRSLGWLNSYAGLIVPLMIPAFGIFLIRQYAVTSVPDDLMEAARIEGATETQIFVKIGFPILMPAVVSLVVLTFMNSWNDFLWPLIVVTKKELFTVSVALRAIADPTSVVDLGMVFAAATISVLPILLLYAFMNKKMVEAMLEGTGKEG